MNRDGYETAYDGPGGCITGYDNSAGGTEDMLGYATELTPAGEQLVIPGTERQPVAGKPAQLSLFGG
jgi:hypothetical protein